MSGSGRPDPPEPAATLVQISNASRRTILAPADATLRLAVDLVSNRPPRTEGVDWEGAVELLDRLGLQGLAVSTHRRRPFLPDPVAEALEPAYLRTALHTTLTLEAARRAVDALEGAGVPVLLIKGAALVEQGIYRDPGARPMDDADLLVPREEAGRAVEALRGAGFEPWLEWDPRSVEWLDSATFSDGTAPPGAEVDVDLHWRLGYGGLRYGRQEGSAWVWRSADRDRHRPALPAHLVLVAEHLLKHFHVRLHLSGLVDLVRLAGPVEDWRAVRALLEDRPTGGGLAVLLDLARSSFGARVPEHTVEGIGAGWARRTARRLLGPTALLERSTGGGGRLRGLLLRWLLAGSLRGAAAEIRATVLPERAWLRARYGSGRQAGWAGDLRLLMRYWAAVGRWLLGTGVSPVSPNQEFER